MRIMITEDTAAEWQALCKGLAGGKLEPVQTFTMELAPMQYGQVSLFDIDRNTKLATWIALQYPDWEEPAFLAEHEKTIIWSAPKGPGLFKQEFETFKTKHGLQ